MMDEKLKLVVPTLLGLEAFTAREVRRLGYETTKVEDGKITFLGDPQAICRANLHIRTGERVLLQVGQFSAKSFEELFQETKKLPWSRFIPPNGQFPVKGHCLKSTLASVRDCQAIIKKAAAVALSEIYQTQWLPEDGAVYQIQFSIHKDLVTLMIDTSGEPLHKRGYRTQANLAPLRETIAAAMVLLSYWKFEYPLWDPFCGSGTIPIEAAMIKRNMAPGLLRTFAGEHFTWMNRQLWESAREEARAMERDVPLSIAASDIDSRCVEIARENAKRAGVEAYITFFQADAAAVQDSRPYGTIICNPPYGERMGEKKDCERLYQAIGKRFGALDRWSYYILTSHEDFEVLFGRKANKKRKLYNGMIKCDLYQYFGPKPQ